MSLQKNFFVIVNYNSGHHIISSIKSILSSKNITPYIIVIDNASTDNSLEKCKSSFPAITYIKNSHNAGFGAGANIGARHALKEGAHTITFVNPDAILKSDCMFHVFKIIENNIADIISPLIYKDNKKDIWFSGGHIDFWRMRAVHTSTANLPQILPKNAFISGCVMTISREVFDKIGFFDERFFLYYEDVDLSFRAQENGFNLTVTKEAIAYHEEVSEYAQENKTYFLVLSGLLFFSKHAKFLRRPYFHAHFTLRKIKNYFDRKKNTPFSKIVHKAFIDYEKNL